MRRSVQQLEVLEVLAGQPERRVPMAEVTGGRRTVVSLLRRFGWLFCREGASELSRLRPELDALGVRLVAVGHERLGLDEFVKGGFFRGPVYLDLDKALYKELGASRASVFSLLSPAMWKSASRAKSKGFDGNMSGDGLQLGGLMVVEPGGEISYAYQQPSFGEHPSAADVLGAARQGMPPEPVPAEVTALERAADGGAATEEALARVRRLASESRAHVFGHSRCPSTARAKRVLGEMVPAPFTHTDLDAEPPATAADLVRALRQETGRPRHPWVFVEGKFVGGGDETLDLFAAGKLEHLRPAAPAQK